MVVWVCVMPRCSADLSASCSGLCARGPWDLPCVLGVWHESPGGVSGYVEVMAPIQLGDELRGTGVGVTTVFPGFIRDAGMFHDAKTKLPPGVGTRTPDDVARAVLKGIDTGRAEIDVAPLSLASGARIFGLAPGLVTGINRRLGSVALADELAEGQRDKR